MENWRLEVARRLPTLEKLDGELIIRAEECANVLQKLDSPLQTQKSVEWNTVRWCPDTFVDLFRLYFSFFAVCDWWFTKTLYLYNLFYICILFLRYKEENFVEFLHVRVEKCKADIFVNLILIFVVVNFFHLDKISYLGILSRQFYF